MVMVEGIVIYKILGRLDDSRWCALTECAVWKDGVLKLCESSGWCECNGIFKGGGGARAPPLCLKNEYNELN